MASTRNDTIRKMKRGPWVAPSFIVVMNSKEKRDNGRIFLPIVSLVTIDEQNIDCPELDIIYNGVDRIFIVNRPLIVQRIIVNVTDRRSGKGIGIEISHAV